MIKNPKRYRKKTERKRAEALRRLTSAQSVRLVEGVLSTRLVHELHFEESEPPVCLARLLERKRKG